MHPDALRGRATLLLLLAACGGADRPATAGKADTAAARDSGDASASTPSLLAYVTNEGSGEVTIIDVARDSAVGTIQVGTRPRGARVRSMSGLLDKPRIPRIIAPTTYSRAATEKSRRAEPIREGGPLTVSPPRTKLAEVPS